MKYETENKNISIVDGENNVSSVKNALISLLPLSDTEKERILSINTTKELLSLVNNPSDFFSDENTKRFIELKELLDLLGGVYYA